MAACIRYSKLDDLECKSTLFFEFHGSDSSVQEQATQVEALSDEFGGAGFQWATSPEARNRLWDARHNVFYAACAAAPGRQAMATDICVPISKLAECILDTKRDVQESNIYAPIVGHVGDGNYHLCLMFDPDDADEMARAKALVERMNQRAISFGGTCTGEHGIGQGKKQFLVAEHGDSVALMRDIKQIFDPDNIMNPGKILTM